MVDDLHFEKQIDKSPYLSNGLTDLEEIWHSDVQANASTHTLHLLFSLKPQEIFKNKTDSNFSVVKVIALKQQTSKF